MGHDGLLAVWDVAVDEGLLEGAGAGAGEGPVRGAVERREMTLVLPVATYAGHAHPAADVAVTAGGVASVCVAGCLGVLSRPRKPAPSRHRRQVSSSTRGGVPLPGK